MKASEAAKFWADKGERYQRLCPYVLECMSNSWFLAISREHMRQQTLDIQSQNVLKFRPITDDLGLCTPRHDLLKNLGAELEAFTMLESESHRK